MTKPMTASDVIGFLGEKRADFRKDYEELL
jgi:hypothetical protein